MVENTSGPQVWDTDLIVQQLCVWVLPQKLDHEGTYLRRRYLLPNTELLVKGSTLLETELLHDDPDPGVQRGGVLGGGRGGAHVGRAAGGPTLLDGGGGRDVLRLDQLQARQSGSQAVGQSDRQSGRKTIP
eukprot:3853796-Pyramimonas_sp.AAC.2